MPILAAVFRRRQTDPVRQAQLEAYLSIAEKVETAQQALLRAVPTFRDDGVALGIAIVQMNELLDSVEDELSRWDAPEELVNRCRTALDQARAEAERVRVEPSDLVFEALNACIGDILYPLETFVDVEAELRENLRR